MALIKKEPASEQGVALIMAMLVLMVMSIVIMGMATDSDLDLKISRNLDLKNKAFNNAETGISLISQMLRYAINTCENNQDMQTLEQNFLDTNTKYSLKLESNQINDVCDLDEGNAIKDISINKGSDKKKIATGTIKKIYYNLDKNSSKTIYGISVKGFEQLDTISKVRTTFAVKKYTHFGDAMTGCQDITLNGDATVDSYNSSVENYDPNNYNSNADLLTTSTPGDISVGNAEIEGTANSVGQVTVKPNGSVDERSTGIEPTECDPLDVTGLVNSKDSGGDTKDINSGEEYYHEAPSQIDSISLSGNNELVFDTGNEEAIFVKGDLTVSGNSQIILREGTSLKLYVQGEIDLAGNGFVNENQQSSSLLIYSSHTSDKDGVKIGGNSAFNGAIYAPLTNVKLHGNADFYGAIRGETVKEDGTPGFHYDEDLENINSIGPAGLNCTSWKNESL